MCVREWGSIMDTHTWSCFGMEKVDDLVRKTTLFWNYLEFYTKPQISNVIKVTKVFCY